MPVSNAIRLLFGLFFLTLAACAPPNTQDIWNGLVREGGVSGFQPLNIQAGQFTLAALLKNEPSQSDLLVVYLEGDGRVTVGGKPSSDPSPHTAQGFRLAVLDPAPKVLYLARIGQYQPENCGPDYQKYWLTARLADEAVEAASRAIDLMKSRTGTRRVQLIGYSGGGGLAALVAARRSDVSGIVTVAGLLSHRWWTEQLKVRPLAESLDPYDFATELASIPQIHFYGKSDRIVAPSVSARFVDKSASTNVVRVGEDCDHWNNWTALWPGLLNRYVVPGRHD